MTKGDSSLDDERAVLAYMLVDQDCLRRGQHRLRVDDFVDDFHRDVFSVLQEVNAIDDATLPRVASAAKEKNSNAIFELGRILAHGEHWMGTTTIHGRMKFHEARLQAATARRGLRVMAEAIMADEDHAELEAKAREDSQRMVDIQGLNFKSALLDTMSTLDREHVDEHRSYFGLPGVDEQMGGMEAGEVCVLAALTGRGKTSLSLWATAHNCARGRQVLFFSLEMEQVSMHKRLLAATANVQLSKLFDADLNSQERTRVVKAANEIGNWNLHLACGNQTLSSMEQTWDTLQQEHGELDLVVVDYLQLIRHADPKVGLHQRALDNCRGVVHLAKQFQCPVILLCQLSREATKDKFPKLHHLRDSGTIEQDCTQAILLYDDHEAVDGGWVPMVFDIAKNRRGALACCRVEWYPATQRYREPGDDFQ